LQANYIMLLQLLLLVLQCALFIELAMPGPMPRMYLYIRTGIKKFLQANAGPTCHSVTAWKHWTS